ncbi:putative cytochrome P450 pisatin demethylase-like protein [Podospora australis]|uniref:Cytochrome P450 pisatin demethylase-like protein n=1 Tax=Podospora australis TaxID=1536484 RepID=A0AAN6WWW3_9PEZI|nr:putative cytochrome P450 pisatin demethylase-like protein [Podospora australis]
MHLDAIGISLQLSLCAFPPLFCSITQPRQVTPHSVTPTPRCQLRLFPSTLHCSVDRSAVMILDSVLRLVAATAPAAVLIGILFLILSTCISWSRHRSVPGPFLASISNLPRLGWAWSGQPHTTQIQLHNKYGKLVRVGPNCLSVGDPHEINKIYGTGSNMQKSDYYKVLQPMSRGKIIQGLFNTQDEKLHRAMKRPIAGIYSMSNLVEFEPYVDTTIQFFLQRLEEVQQKAGNKAFDLGTWLQWFAFDVMGEITFSKRLGFLDEGKDVDGIIGSIWNVFLYASWVGQMPWLDKLWVKNRLIRRFLPESDSPVVKFALARARERTNIGEAEKTASPYNSKDFMSRFLEARVKNPEIPEWFITAWTTSNVLAGSDTTAIMMRSIIYFLLKHPESLEKLMAELAQAHSEGRLSEITTWKESRDLPYLDACVKEAGRLHPVIGLPLERVVPKGGVELCGRHVPEDTVVGMNPWVIHRSEEVFGPDVDKFYPDRWLRVDKEKRAEMERCLLTFGSGHRTCIGKNISYLEIYKLIPTMFWRYKMSLEGDWNVVNHWLVIQTDLHVRLTPRGPGTATTEKV